MNTRDPFGLHRKSALSVLQAGVSIAANSAVTLSRQTLETSKQAYETGKQALEESGVLPDGMSFSVPNHVPSFTNPQRRHEDSRWGSSGTLGPRSAATARSGAGAANVGDRIGGYFKENDLPLYKDKPFTYAASRRHRPLWRRKRVFATAGLLFLGVLYWMGFLSPDKKTTKVGQRLAKSGAWSWLKTGESKVVDWDARRERVKEAFILSWDAYEQYAWGTFNSRKDSPPSGLQFRLQLQVLILPGKLTASVRL
jgi:endoplasmic reticulum Man9GlcNAc2 1,2-alpha-mannosidase